jgi:hypothetical protein
MTGVDQRDSARMIQLAREGKQISRIVEEDFPQYDYWEVYWEVNLAGESSAQGTMKKISNRLLKLRNTKNQDLVDETRELIRALYTRYREDHKKLDAIRKTLGL